MLFLVSDEGIYTINCLLKLKDNMIRELVPKIGPRARLVERLDTYRTHLDNIPEQDIKHNLQNTSVVMAENYIVDSNGMLIPDSNDMSHFHDKCEGIAPHAAVLDFEVNGESADGCHCKTDTVSVPEVSDVSSDNNRSSGSFVAVDQCSASRMTDPLEFREILSEKCQANVAQANVAASQTHHPDSVGRIYQKPTNDPASTDSLNFRIDSTTYESSAKIARLEKGAVFKDNKVHSRFSNHPLFSNSYDK